MLASTEYPNRGMEVLPIMVEIRRLILSFGMLVMRMDICVPLLTMADQIQLNSLQNHLPPKSVFQPQEQELAKTAQ